jgi:cystathionine beta-lyase
MTKDRPEKRPATRLIHPDAHANRDFGSLSMPVFRASTVLFDTLAEAHDKASLKGDYTYGLHGTPTTRELALRVAELEGGNDCLLLPSGLAAIALTYLALTKSGDHVLVPESAYGPNARLGREMTARFGVDVEPYDPMIGGEIAGLLRDNTALVWCESPGSVTMEVQDLPAIAAAAHARDAVVALDNTYGAGVLFNAFDLGADISLQALTKYVAGHSDVLMGSLSTRDADLARRLGTAHQLYGQGVSPDEASLALRGMATMRLRMKAVEDHALAVATWLKARPEVENVLHTALPDCPGHAAWKRDFSGSAGVFSVIFRDWDWSTTERFVEALTLFPIGYSWGGVVSLVMAYKDFPRPSPDEGNRLVRFNIGLEDPADLIADIEQALNQASSR